MPVPDWREHASLAYLAGAYRFAGDNHGLHNAGDHVLVASLGSSQHRAIMRADGFKDAGTARVLSC
jgi:hypothetical protein